MPSNPKRRSPCGRNSFLGAPQQCAPLHPGPCRRPQTWAWCSGTSRHASRLCVSSLPFSRRIPEKDVGKSSQPLLTTVSIKTLGLNRAGHCGSDPCPQVRPDGPARSGERWWPAGQMQVPVLTAAPLRSPRDPITVCCLPSGFQSPPGDGGTPQQRTGESPAPCGCPACSCPSGSTTAPPRHPLSWGHRRRENSSSFSLILRPILFHCDLG